ncbi:MAG: hypothetical protein MZV63_24275 [Marinilabiliales bacterium]|nr:hypothetical protein [Marinilabiliales bacterium]
MEFSTFLFFALIGYIDGGVAPIVDPANPVKIYVDPLTSGTGAYGYCYRTCHNGNADGDNYQALQEIQNI